MAAPFHLIEEAKRMIRFNTVTSSSNAECAVYVGSLLRKLGAQVSYQQSRVDGISFFNVVGAFGAGKNSLLLTTHLDTVDPGDRRLWTKTGQDPWRLTVRGDTLYGLGVADTKLDLLCKLLAVGQLPKRPWKRPLIVLGTFGEESGLRGAACFCQGEFPKPAAALVGEPSELGLVNRHKGLIIGELTLKSKGLHRPSAAQWRAAVHFAGKAAHSSSPALGINALRASMEFIRSLQAKYRKIRVLSWEAGNAHNIIPASASLRFSLGEHPKVSFRITGAKVKVERLSPGWYPTLPWEDLLWFDQALQDLLGPYEKEKERGFNPPMLTWSPTTLKQTPQGWCLTFDLRFLPGQPGERLMRALEGKLWKKWGPPGPTWQFRLERDNPALDLPSKEPLLKCVASALRRARVPVKVTAKAGCSEAGLYARVGIPSVVIGPGRATGNIHQPNESVSVKQLRAAIRFYKAFLEKECF